MGERQDRWCLTQDGGGSFGCVRPRSRFARTASARVTAVIGSVACFLLAAPAFSTGAWTQDAAGGGAAQQPPVAPAVPETQKEAPPLPPDAPKQGIPPAPPLDDPKAATPTPDGAQAKPAAAPEDPATAAPPGGTEALSKKYRFREKYSTKADPAHPELVTQYRVGTSERRKNVWDNPEGAPGRSETSRRTFYSERIAQLDRRVGDVVAAVRRYDKVEIKDTTPRKAPNPPLLNGLTIWYTRRPVQKPQILSLTPDRPLRELEYHLITVDTFLPQLSFLLPSEPKRVGDSWPIPSAIAKTVWNEESDPVTYEMTASLISVTKAKEGTAFNALLGIVGRLDFLKRAGSCTFNARILFEFKPPIAAAPSGPQGTRPSPAGRAESRDDRGTGIVDARGWIIQAVMAQSVERPIPGSDERLKESSTRVVTLERIPFEARPNEAPVPALDVPEVAPVADNANSWLVFEDPRGRFRFRHPQELQIPDEAVYPPEEIHLLDERVDVGKDVLVIKLPPKGGDPKIERTFHDPALLQKAVDAEWAREQMEVIHGEAGWLQDPKWKQSNRRVYRLEVGVKPKEGVETYKRLIIDYYLVALERNQNIMVDSWTIREDHVPFRNNVEDVIRSFEFNPPDGTSKAATKPAAAPAEKPAAPRN